MELTKHLTDAEHLELSKHLEAAEAIISKAMGAKCDIVSVAHKRHADEEKCSGIAIMTQLQAFDTFMMLARASYELEAKARDEFVLRNVSANQMPC